MASIATQLQQELFDGVREERGETMREMHTFSRVTGATEPNYKALEKPIYLAPLRDGVLGVTGISKDGEVKYIAVNSRIPVWVERAMRVYGKSLDWAKRTVRQIAQNTTGHELTHGITSKLARGEDVDARAVSIMESLTTYGRYLTAKALGKYVKAEMIKNTNPYPNAWALGELANSVPYQGPSGKGYAAFIMDSNKEKFYRPWGRLMDAARRAGAKIADLSTPALAYAR